MPHKSPFFLLVSLFVMSEAKAAGPPAWRTHQPIDGSSGCDVCHPAGDTGTASLGLSSESLTTDCLSCHDGSLSGVPMGLREPGRTGEHPTHIAFRGDDLHSVNDVLSTGLRLYDGDGEWTVECTSCHDPHLNGSPAMLRGEPGGLCLGCHDK